VAKLQKQAHLEKGKEKKHVKGSHRTGAKNKNETAGLSRAS